MVKQQLKDQMRKRILLFLEKQPGYSTQKLKIMYDEPDWFVLYGEDLSKGIAGFGKTEDEVVEDFKKNWERYNGERSIKKNR